MNSKVNLASFDKPEKVIIGEVENKSKKEKKIDLEL